LTLSKDNFHILFRLSKKQPWLTDKYEELQQLLFADCSNQEQKDLILDLLNRFKYISGENFGLSLTEMAEDIVTDPDLSDETTQIVAMAAGSGTDSSQYILYSLKRILQENEWEKHKFTNTFGKIYSSYKKIKKHKNIVLIDEFVGSGRTVIGRIREIKKVFDAAGVTDYRIKVKVIVSTEIGKNAILASGTDFSSQIIIKKGISDYYSNQEFTNKIDLMLCLEDLLKQNYEGHELPSLGFGKTESLYCREGGNTPNSVFPIFWWPIYVNGNRRSTVLTRAMIDA
jgi:hypothetical protein